MINLFFSPKGIVNRLQFGIAFAALAIFIISLNTVSRWIGVETMASFLLYTLTIPVFLYCLYQVFKKRLHHMGFTARPFWIFLFLWIFLMIGCLLYFGAGDHLNEVWTYNEQYNKGMITEDERNALIQAKEATYRETLSQNLLPTEIILSIPAVFFLLWLAVTPGKQKDT